MSSWKKKMRVKWNRNLDGMANGSEGTFERHGSLRKPKEPNKEEPFKRSWSFRLGSNKDTGPVEQADKDSDRHNVLLRLFRFKDKKRGSVSDGRNSSSDRRPSAPCALPAPRRRMSDAPTRATEADVRLSSGDLPQWASVPADVNNGMPSLPESQQELCQWGSVPAGMVTGDEEGPVRSHTLPRGLPGVRSSPLLTGEDGRVEDRNRDKRPILGVIYCAPEAAKMVEHGKKKEAGRIAVTKAEARTKPNEMLKLPRPEFLGLGKLTRKPLEQDATDCAKVVDGTGIEKGNLHCEKKDGKAATAEEDGTIPDNPGEPDTKGCTATESAEVNVFSKAIVPHFIQLENSEKGEPREEGADIKVLLLNGSLRTNEVGDITTGEKVAANSVVKSRKLVGPGATTTPNGDSEDVSPSEATYDANCQGNEPTLGLQGGSSDAQNTAPSIPLSTDVPAEKDRKSQINGVGDARAEFVRSRQGGLERPGQEFDVHDDYEEDSIFETSQCNDYPTGIARGGQSDGSQGFDLSFGDVNVGTCARAHNTPYVLEPDESFESLLDFSEEATILEEKGISSLFAIGDFANDEGKSEDAVSCGGEGTALPSRDKKTAPNCRDDDKRCLDESDGVHEIPNDRCNVTNIFIDSAGPKVLNFPPVEADDTESDFVTYVEVDPSAETSAADVLEPTTGTPETAVPPPDDEDSTGNDVAGTCNSEDTMEMLNPLKLLCDANINILEGANEDDSTSPGGSTAESACEVNSHSETLPSSDVQTSRDASPDTCDYPQEEQAITNEEQVVESPASCPSVQEGTHVTNSEHLGTAPLSKATSEQESDDSESLQETMLVEQPGNDVVVPCEEASFREKLEFFDSISSPARTPSDVSKHTKFSRIPLPSRLPRPSSKAKQDTPVPAKRLRTDGLPPNTKSTRRFGGDDLIAKRSKKLPKNAGDAPLLTVARPDLKTNECVAPVTFENQRNAKLLPSEEAADIGASQRLEAAKSKREVMKTPCAMKRIPSRTKPLAKKDKVTKPQKTKVPPSNKECSMTAEKLSDKPSQTPVDADVLPSGALTPGGLTRSRTFVRDEDEDTTKSVEPGEREDATSMNKDTAVDGTEAKDVLPQQELRRDTVVQVPEDTVVQEVQEPGEVSVVDGPSANDDHVNEQYPTEMSPGLLKHPEVVTETKPGISSDAEHMPSARVAKHARDVVAAIMDSVQVPVVDSTNTVGDDYVVEYSDTFQANKKPNSTLKVPIGIQGRGKAGGDTRAGHPLTKAEFTKEIQRLGALCEARTKEANFLKLQLKHASAGFAAFSILLRHLTEQHNVFSIPHLTEELQKSRQEIDRAHVAIEQYKEDIEQLKQKQLEEIKAMKEKVARERTLQLEELEEAHKSEISFYTESHAKKTEELKTFYTSIIEGDRKSHDDAIDALREKHREKIEAINEEYAIQLDAINDEHAAQQAQLEAKHAALVDQYRALQEQAREFQSSVLLDTDSKIQWLSKKNADLEKEVDSLNVVLEMRAEQIQALQRSKLEMERKEEELERCKDRIQKLEARNEDLQELLNEKAKMQSQLSLENAVLREKSEKQNRQLSRLDMTNEQLKYKLRESTNTSFTYERGSVKPRTSPPKRFSGGDPTAMSRSWHSERSSGGATRKTSSLRSQLRSLTLPHANNRQAGCQPDNRKVRRSMSDSVPNADCIRTRLFSTDEEDNTSFDFERSQCSHDELLRLTWVCSPEGSDNSRVSSRCKKSPNQTTSSSSESGGSLPDQAYNDGLSDGSSSVDGQDVTLNGSAAFRGRSPRCFAGEAMVMEETATVDPTAADKVSEQS